MCVKSRDKYDNSTIQDDRTKYEQYVTPTITQLPTDRHSVYDTNIYTVTDRLTFSIWHQHLHSYRQTDIQYMTPTFTQLPTDWHSVYDTNIYTVTDRQTFSIWHQHLHSYRQTDIQYMTPTFTQLPTDRHSVYDTNIYTVTDRLTFRRRFRGHTTSCHAHLHCHHLFSSDLVVFPCCANLLIHTYTICMVE